MPASINGNPFLVETKVMVGFGFAKLGESGMLDAAAEHGRTEAEWLRHHALCRGSGWRGC